MRLIKVAVLALLSVMTYEVYAKRVALVIGNAAYEHENKLTNPVNDAVLLQSTLKNDLHFDNVKLVKNADFRTLNRTINEFNQTAQDADIAVIYFSGHGQQGADRQNYLLATDAHIENLVDLRTGAVTSDELINATQGAKARIVILDACRDRPNSGFKSATKGLSRVQVTGDELLIAYATDAGKVAQDGQTGNSPYATALAQVMRKKDKSIMGMFDEVKNQVRTMTKGQQVPTREGNLSINIYFIQPTINLQENTNSDAELVFWDSIKNETDAESYQTYLKQYPNGRFSHLAKARIQKYTTKPNQSDAIITQTLEADNSILMQKGMWRDPKTNLIWMRCSLGQIWDGATCSGNAETYSLENAKQMITEMNQKNFAGYNDWRLPNIAELANIRYCSKGFSKVMQKPYMNKRTGETKLLPLMCDGFKHQKPTLDTQIFPNTPQKSVLSDLNYWTSSVQVDAKIIGISFGSGLIMANSIDSKNYVRMVRGEEQ
ncbi:caspase family protein [Acinetobacter sp. WCHA29]|uniref:caspase family protein n=1 Tax=Acinetobacter sp. WCHA29 TaxID=2004649 RepID=UPI000B3C06AC|nr:caspase family protein [Acinetobacter sp. WCHA29]